MCQTRVSNQPSTHTKYLFVLNACLNVCLSVCLFVLNACDILYLLQGSQWDRNHQNSHQNRAQDLLKIEGTRIIIFGQNCSQKILTVAMQVAFAQDHRQIFVERDVLQQVEH